MKPPQKKRSIKMKLQKVSKRPVSESEDEVEEFERPNTPPRKPKVQYGAYTTENLIAAVKAVKEQGMSTYKAAELYGVPKSTIYDKVTICGMKVIVFPFAFIFLEIRIE